MKEKEIVIRVISCQLNDLNNLDKKLVIKAMEATRTSLATYSKFHVGAAILMDNGEVVTGSNQENAAYPSGTCAERTAAFYASAKYPGVAMKKIAIAAWTKEGKPADLPYEEYFQQAPISPCGACRQALLEYEALYGQIEVLLYGKEEILIFPSISSLLPLSFTEF